jgi:DNA-binding LacI/PurR family transcriptional regulator
MPVTIYDVAKQAGVSTATVSKVLSNTPYVSEKTRAKVLTVVEALDFVPSLAARGLSGAHTQIIGLAFPYAPDDLFDDPHLMNFMLGVQQMTAERDYSLLLVTARPGDDPGSALRRLLRTQYVDAAIVVGMTSTRPIAAEMRHRAYPTVALGYDSPSDPANAIHVDDRRGGVLAARHLVELGHRRIGLIAGPEDITATTERAAGFRSALTEDGLTLDAGLVAEGDFTSQSGYAAARRLLDLPNPPTAIFSVNDRMALGCIAFAQQASLAVPGDLSVIGFDDIPAAAYSAPPLTTVRQPSRIMGHLAAQRVFDLLEGKQDELEPLVLPVDLVIRGSTSRPKA